MTNRLSTSMGATTLLAAVATALLTGAGAATADPGRDAAATDAAASSADGPRDGTPAGPGENDSRDQRAAAEPSEPSEQEAENTEDTTVPEDTTGPEGTTVPEDTEDVAPDTDTTRESPQLTGAKGSAASSGRSAAQGATRPAASTRLVASAPEADKTVSLDVPAERSIATIDTPRVAPALVEAIAASVAPQTTAAAMPATAAIAPVQKFFRAVGSTVLNALMGLIQLFAGPPVLPANSSVTVRSSTLSIPVGSGRKVNADWYFPDIGGEPPTRLIYLQHGFGAVSSMYSYNAAALAERTNSIVVAPTLTSNFLDAGAVWLGGTPMQDAVAQLFAGDRNALTESASAAAGYQVTLPRRFTMIGHSLGATLVMGAAGRMVDNGAAADLAGVLLFDGVDVNDTVPKALDKLVGGNSVPVQNISSERYQWNRYGLVSDQLQAARPGAFNGVMLRGGRHIDGLQGGNPLLQFAEYVVAGFSTAPNVEAVRILAAGWINDMFAGTNTGIYAEPGQSVRIPTAAGPAVAVVLPIGSPDAVRVTPWDGIMAVFLDAIVRVAIYEPPSATARDSFVRA